MSTAQPQASAVVRGRLTCTPITSRRQVSITSGTSASGMPNDSTTWLSTSALVVLAIGFSPTSALVLSQVVLSFGIPLALVPLVMLTCRRDVMGVHVNRPLTTALAWGCAVLISALNLFLLYQQLLAG